LDHSLANDPAESRNLLLLGLNGKQVSRLRSNIRKRILLLARNDNLIVCFELGG